VVPNFLENFYTPGLGDSDVKSFRRAILCKVMIQMQLLFKQNHIAPQSIVTVNAAITA
jgi:hypothetical protein